MVICSGMPVEHQAEWGKDLGLTNYRCHQKPIDLFEFSRLIDELLKANAPESDRK